MNQQLINWEAFLKRGECPVHKESMFTEEVDVYNPDPVGNTVDLACYKCGLLLSDWFPTTDEVEDLEAWEAEVEKQFPSMGVDTYAEMI